jgi:hypothetical protein
VILAQVAAADLVEVVAGFRIALCRHETTINRLNVFPVPDGDTGTNMLRTVEAAERAISAASSSDADVLAAIARGSLMGARGNSGVILSQILRALSGACAATVLDADGLAAAYAKAADDAYGAVLRPVEGTLLTVARRAADAAAGAGAAGAGLIAVATAARDAAREALAQTPDLLPVLAEAGVVDAGGAGLLQLFEAFLAVVTGVPAPLELPLPARVADLIATALDPISASEETAHRPGEPGYDDDGPRYEVMFILEAPDALIGTFKTAWGALGDAIVVVGGDGIFNCHIHTDEIGPAIDAAIAIGRPLQIRVTDLHEQVEALEGTLASRHHEPPPYAPDRHRNPAVTDIVAVCQGAGIASILRSLGVAEVVPGGQSMNPSTEELLDAIGAVVSREVIVLPNNSNIVPVAREAAKLAGRAVIVVPTTSVQAGIASLVAYDPGATAEENAARMTSAAASVTSGEVTRAARAASTAVGDVAAGSWIGVSADGVVATAKSCAETAAALVDALRAPSHEIVTIIEGSDVPDGELEVLLELLAMRHPTLAVEHLVGGQPVYPLLLALE